MSETQGKSFVTALLLCIFLGGLGVHRFYTGHIKTGVGMLVLGLLSVPTFGITGFAVFVWAVIDIVNICTGKFVAADGSALVR
jgi:TM2 domain-containing membrane protein YozV